MHMEAERIEKSLSREETRRGFLKKSGKTAAGVAVALPIVMTLRPDQARATGSGRVHDQPVDVHPEEYDLVKDDGSYLTFRWLKWPMR